MPQRYRQSIILLGVMLAAFAWYFGYEKAWKNRSKEKEESGKQLVSLKKDDVKELEYTRITNAPDGIERPKDFSPIPMTVKLKKLGKDWQLLAPVEDMADNGTVDGLLSTVTTAKQERVVDETPKDLAAYGLDQPAIVATLKGGGAPETIKIGANTPVGYSSYALGNGQKAVWKVSKSLRSAFEKDLFALRNKLVLPLTRSDVTEVEVQAKGSSYLVKKESGDKWLLAREGVPADNNEWPKVLNQWLDARAILFPEGTKKLSTYGLEPPRARVTFTKPDGQKVTLVLGKTVVDKKDKFYAKRLDKDTVFEVDKTPLEAAEKPVADLFDKQLSRFNRFEVSRIKIERKDGDFELAKVEKGNWEFVAPEAMKAAKKLELTRVDALLTKLQDTKVLRYEPGKPKLAAGAVATTIRVFTKRGTEEKEAVALRFGKKTGKTVSGDRTDAMAPFVLDSEHFAPFDVAASYYQGEGKTVGAPEKPPVAPSGEEHSADDGHGHG